MPGFIDPAAAQGQTGLPSAPPAPPRAPHAPLPGKTAAPAWGLPSSVHLQNEQKDRIQHLPAVTPSPLKPPAPDPAIENVQKQLVRAGYKITVDGVMGPQTAAAMSDFTKHGGNTGAANPAPSTSSLLGGDITSAFSHPLRTAETVGHDLKTGIAQGGDVSYLNAGEGALGKLDFRAGQAAEGVAPQWFRNAAVQSASVLPVSLVSRIGHDSAHALQQISDSLISLPTFGYQVGSIAAQFAKGNNLGGAKELASMGKGFVQQGRDMLSNPEQNLGLWLMYGSGVAGASSGLLARTGLDFGALTGDAESGALGALRAGKGVKAALFRAPGEGGSLLRTPLGKPRSLVINGESAPLLESGNHAWNMVEQLYDKVLQHSLDHHAGGRIAEHAMRRVAAFQSATGSIDMQVTDAMANRLAQATRKARTGLKPFEQRALNLTSENTPVPERMAYVAKQLAAAQAKGDEAAIAAHTKEFNLLKQIHDSGITKEISLPDGTFQTIIDPEVSPHLAGVDSLLARSQALLNHLRQMTGEMDKHQLEVRENAPGQIIRGGKGVNFKDEVRDVLENNPERQMLHTAIYQHELGRGSTPELAARAADTMITFLDHIAYNHSVGMGDALRPDELYKNIASIKTVVGGDPETWIKTLKQQLSLADMPGASEKITTPERGTQPVGELSTERARAMAKEIIAAGHKLPFGMKTEAALAKRIQTLYKTALAGAHHADWYQRAAQSAQTVAAWEEVPVKTVEQLMAIFSQTAEPTANMKFVITAIQEFKHDGSVQSLGAGGKPQAAKAQAVLNGQDWEGRKTNTFYQNIAMHTPGLEDEITNPEGVTVDRHATDLVAPGLSGSPARFYGGIEKTYQSVAKELGWTPQEVQATTWVVYKANKLMARFPKWTKEKALLEARDAYEAGVAKWGAQLRMDVGDAGTIPRDITPRVPDELDVLQNNLNAAAGSDLIGLPGHVKVSGFDRPITFRSSGDLQALSREFEQMIRNHTYVRVNPDRATRIADWYDQATHDPSDPAVKSAYDAFTSETLAQYRALEKAGYTFEFYPEGEDPYPLGPRQAMLDLSRNRHLYVYPTDSGFGSGEGASADHPLLANSGIEWGGRQVTHNDLFRAVHDVFGHGKEGVGFGADGEENAFQSHRTMYSRKAQKAMASETRSQNSWVSFGPHGEATATADQSGAVHAPQKAVVAPDWVINEGTPRPTVEVNPALAWHRMVTQHAIRAGAKVTKGSVSVGAFRDAETHLHDWAAANPDHPAAAQISDLNERAVTFGRSPNPELLFQHHGPHGDPLAYGVNDTLVGSGGHTWDPQTLTSLPDDRGFAYLERGYEEQIPATEFTAADVTRYRDEHQAQLKADPTLKIGSWNQGGIVHLDLTHVIDDREEAIRLGEKNGQKAVYDIAKGEDIPLHRNLPPAFAVRQGLDEPTQFGGKQDVAEQQSPQRGGSLEGPSVYGIQGAVYFDDLGTHFILTHATNFSTWAHEVLGHFALERGNMDANSIKTIIREAGVKPEEGSIMDESGNRMRGSGQIVNHKAALSDLTPKEYKQVHEFFAQQMESYLKQGAGTNSALTRALKSASMLMKDIYDYGELPELHTGVRDAINKMFETNAPEGQGIIGGEDPTHPGRGYVPAYTSEAAHSGKVAGFRSRVIGKTKKPMGTKRYLGGGLENSELPSRPANLLAKELLTANRYMRSTEGRAWVARYGTDERPTEGDPGKFYLVNTQEGPGERVPDEAKVAAGARQSTIEESDFSKWQRFHDRLFVNKDNFTKALDKEQQAAFKEGTAVAGYKWVNQNIIPKELRDITSPGVGRFWKANDAITNAEKNAIVYLKPGHFATRLLANAGFNAIHGSLNPINMSLAFRWFLKVDQDARDRGMAAAGQGYAQSLAGMDTGLGHSAVHAGARAYAHIVDSPFRWNALVLEARKLGINSADKFDAWLKSDDPATMAARNKAGVIANREAGDYARLSPVEQRVVRRLIFFYPWVKASTFFVGRSMLEHPVKMAGIAGTGQEGQQYEQQTLGSLAPQDQGLINTSGLTNSLGLYGDHNFTTSQPSAVNPLATPGLMGESLLGLFGAAPTTSTNEFGSLAGPVPQALIDAAFHLNNYGESAPPGTHYPGILYNDLIGGIPELTLAGVLNKGKANPLAPTKDKEFPASAESQALRFGLGSSFPRPTNRGEMNFEGQYAGAQATGNSGNLDLQNLQEAVNKVGGGTIPPIVVQQIKERADLVSQLKSGMDYGQRAVIAAQVYVKYHADAPGLVAAARSVIDDPKAAYNLYYRIRQALYGDFLQYNQRVTAALRRLEGVGATTSATEQVKT